MRWRTLHSCVSLLLASNFFAFQTELFQEEYEQNNRPLAESASIAAPTLTWESFDKDCAQQAFVVDPGVPLAILFPLWTTAPAELLPNPPYQPVRDKSPPLLPVA